MDTRQFDHLARRISSATRRRALLSALAGGAFGGASLATSHAKRKKKKKKVQVCLNGQTLTVLNKKKGAYFAQGAFEGDCGNGLSPDPGPDPLPDPTCFDGVQNGDETGVDCGGSCGRCANGGTCAGRDDCDSANCESGVCQQCTSSPLCGSDSAGSCTCNNSICTSRSGVEILNRACDACPDGTAACQPAINGRPGVFCRSRCGVVFPPQPARGRG